jgi:putative ABC transport system permease protein
MTRFISYMRASIRLWHKQWVGVTIAVAGLVGALAISLITAMYLYDGMRSDSWLSTSDRLYRVTQTTYEHGKKTMWGSGALTVLPLGPLMEEAVPDMEAYTRLWSIAPKVTAGSETSQTNWLAVDKGFAKVFPLPMITGSLEQVLAAPDRVAFSETEAARYGGLSAIGNTLDISMNGKARLVKVTAIYEDIPSSSHLILPAITLMHEGTMPVKEWMLNWTNTPTYVLAKPTIDQQSLVENFGAAVDHLVPKTHFNRDKTLAHSLEPVKGLMFYSDQGWGGGMKSPMNRDYLNGLMLVSLVLLGSAGFNFVSVFTAINLTRGREIAVRRLAGASGSLLFRTAWVECAVLAMAAYLMALLVAADLGPLAEKFIGTQILVFEAAKLPLLLGGGLLLLVFSFITSSYASARILSKRPADLMRDSQGSVTGGGTRMRQSLVFVQALVLTVILASAAQIQIQTHHLLTMDRGMAQTGVMFVEGPRNRIWDDKKAQDALKAATNQFTGSFRDQLTVLEDVKATASVGMKPFYLYVFQKRMRNPITNEMQPMSVVGVGPDYFRVAGITVLAQLTEDFTAISAPVAIEQRMLTMLGFKSIDGALGQELIAEFTMQDGSIKKYPHKIVAVIKNIKDKDETLSERILFNLKAKYFLGSAHLAVKYDGAGEANIRKAIGGLWQEQFPDYNLNIQTIEELVQVKFQRQTNSGIAVSIIAGICAVLGFAGLYSMAAHWLMTRQRELALRRVMGAGRRTIALYACKKMLLPVFAGALLGVVPAWWVGRLWLEQFTDQAPLPMGAFAVGVLVIAAFATIILLAHIHTALKKRPARVLYHE